MSVDLNAYVAAENKLQVSLSGDAATKVLSWCEDLGELEYVTAQQVPQITAQLALGGRWRRWVIGHSSAGTPIFCLSYEPEDAEKAVVAYGYPHPDEPAGAAALLAFCRKVSASGPPPGLERVSWHVVLCADPDQAAMNATWAASPTLAGYLTGNWRPAYSHLEVDYAFPIEYGPLHQPAWYAPEGMRRPLPESLALADLFVRVHPDVVGMMHGNHASGAYTFLSHRPHPSLVDAFDRLGADSGMPAHLGEKPDPGKRWRRGRGDLLKERKLIDRIRWLHRIVGDFDGRKYLGCVSAGMYLEALNPACVVLTPEVGLFDVPGIDNVGSTDETRRVVQRVERTRRGDRWITRGKMRLPDGSQKEVCYHIRPAAEAGEPGERVVPLTRGMAGVEAVETRRFWLRKLDGIYHRYESRLTREGPRRTERQNINVPAGQVNDRAMLIFRTSAQYLRAATVAEVADFRSRWMLENVRWIGHAMQLYSEQQVRPAHQAAAAHFERAITDLDHLTVRPLDAQARSQLGRLLLCAAGQVT